MWFLFDQMYFGFGIEDLRELDVMYIYVCILYTIYIYIYISNKASWEIFKKKAVFHGEIPELNSVFHGFSSNVSERLDGDGHCSWLNHIPYAPCMVYLPTFTLKITQM